MSEAPDTASIQRREKQDKPGARTEADRRFAELEALTAGLATEVSRVYEKLDACEAKLGELILLLKGEPEAKRRSGKKLKLEPPQTHHMPGFHNGDEDED